MRFAALPLVAAILSGCDEYEIVECAPERQEYIDLSVAWTIDNSATIDALMAAHWHKPRTPMYEIIDALEDAKIQCGIENKEGDGIAASHLDPGNRIVIDMASDYFVGAFAMYQASSWTTAYTLAELDDKNNPSIDRTEHPSPLNDSLSYETSLGYMAYLLTHEAEHEVVGDHTQQAKDEADRIREEYGNAVGGSQLKRVDQIYAIGWWALETSQDLWEQQRDTYLDTLSQ